MGIKVEIKESGGGYERRAVVDKEGTKSKGTGGQATASTSRGVDTSGRRLEASGSSWPGGGKGRHCSKLLL